MWTCVCLMRLPKRCRACLTACRIDAAMVWSAPTVFSFSNWDNSHELRRRFATFHRSNSWHDKRQLQTFLNFFRETTIQHNSSRKAAGTPYGESLCCLALCLCWLLSLRWIYAFMLDDVFGGDFTSVWQGSSLNLVDPESTGHQPHCEHKFYRSEFFLSRSWEFRILRNISPKFSRWYSLCNIVSDRDLSRFISWMGWESTAKYVGYFQIAQMRGC